MLRRIFAICAATVWLATIVVAGQPPGMWLDVPFVQQEKNACGAASISMVMRYWAAAKDTGTGTDADPAAIQRQLYSEATHGIYASDMEKYLRSHGFRTFAFRGDWQDLERHLRKGRPLIVGLGQPRTSRLHYVVVAGLNQAEQVVLLNDPARRKLLKQNWRDFERQWSATDYWTLLAVPQ